MKSARRYLVSGLVQGVGFRYFVVRRAAERNLTGFVRNLPDGRVEVLAEGTEEALEGLKSELEIGSQFSKVARVEENAEPPSSLYTGFSVSE